MENNTVIKLKKLYGSRFFEIYSEVNLEIPVMLINMDMILEEADNNKQELNAIEVLTMEKLKEVLENAEDGENMEEAFSKVALELDNILGRYIT